MSRNLDQLASLNAVPSNNGSDEQKHNEEELQMFSNTTFFDYDMGRSTDIATTVDELLMQQEKQIQYPQKQQAHEEAGPVAGPSYTSNSHVNVPQQSAPQYASNMERNELPQQQAPKNLPFDFSTLQGFSLAGELPQASLSIYDVDPIFHESHQPASAQHQDQHRLQVQQHQQQQHQHQLQVQQHQHQLLDNPLHYHQHTVAKTPIVQRHEVAENYAPVESAKSQKRLKTESPNSNIDDLASEGNEGLDEEKRRRNTAASARFRIKKKLREQEMEKNHRIMQQRMADQEDRIKQLEMENSWLRNLVVEKNTARDSTTLGRLREELLLKDGQP